jgi:hypothetical protein
LPSLSLLVLNDESKTISTNVKELRDAITIIQRWTGIPLKISSEYIQYKEFLKIQAIGRIIGTRLALWRPILLTMHKSDALKILDQYMHDKINNESILMLKFSENICGQMIELDNIILNLEAVKTAEEPKTLYESIVAQKEDRVTIKFVQAVNDIDDVNLHVNSLRKIKSLPKLDFPNDVKEFFKESNIKNTDLERLTLAIELIKDFFSKTDTEYEFKVELFEDPEEDWKEIKLTILIRRSLEYIYENIEAEIYDILNRIIPEDSDNLVVKLEPF